MSNKSPKPALGNLKPFKKGNPGGPGNPFAAQVNKLKSALLAATTPDDMKKVIQMLKDKALKERDVAAAKVYMERCLGYPVAPVEVSNADTAESAGARALGHIALMRQLIELDAAAGNHP